MIVATATYHNAMMMLLPSVLIHDANDDDEDGSDGDEMGLDSGFGAKLLLHSPLITKGNLASSLEIRMMMVIMVR